MRTELVIDDQVFVGWTQVSVKASLDNLCREFSLTYTSGLSEERADIKAGQACVVRTVRGDLLLSGWVDTAEDTYDGDSHTLKCTGRSKSADLVDCSVTKRGGMWAHRTIGEIAREIAAAFDITVVEDGGDLTQVARVFAVQEGETGFEMLDRIAKWYGFLWLDRPDGTLVATQAGQLRTKTELVRGQNVVRGSLTTSMLERYSTYSIVGQANGSDTTFGPTVALVRGQVTDEGVTRNRPLRIVSDSTLDPQTSIRRAEWERTVRFGKSLRIGYEVRDWATEEGVWDIGRLVPVRDPTFGINEDLLIASVELAYGPQGSAAKLDLVRPEAYNRDKPIPRQDIIFQAQNI